MTAQPAPHAEGTALPLSGYRQARSYTCGFATTLMVIRYFGADIPARELLRRLGTGRDGTRQNAIMRELRAAGLRANTRYDVDFARVCREIDRNKLIVGYLHDEEHWLVIYGYARDPERVYVADPRPGEPCEQPWHSYQARLNGFGIICSHPQESTAVRQAALFEGDQPPDPDAAPLGPPPAPLAPLRCEVHCLQTVESVAEPAQLAFSF